MYSRSNITTYYCQLTLFTLGTIYFPGNSTCITCHGKGSYLTEEGNCDCHDTYLERFYQLYQYYKSYTCNKGETGNKE